MTVLTWHIRASENRCFALTTARNGRMAFLNESILTALILHRGPCQAYAVMKSFLCPLRPLNSYPNAVVSTPRIYLVTYDGSFKSIVKLPLTSKRIIGFIDRWGDCTIRSNALYNCRWNAEKPKFNGESPKKRNNYFSEIKVNIYFRSMAFAFRQAMVTPVQHLSSLTSPIVKLS